MVVLKSIVSFLTEQLIISDEDFENFVGISIKDWQAYQLSGMQYPIDALANFCILVSISPAQLLQIESFIRRKLGIPRGETGDNFPPETVNKTYWACKQHLEESTTPKPKNKSFGKYTADYNAVIDQVQEEENVNLNIPAYLRRPLS